MVCGLLMKWFKKISWKCEKKSWKPFGSYLLDSATNSAHFYPNWAELAVLFSNFWQLLNGSQDFFVCFNILIFIFFSKYKTSETHARAFLPLNISAVGVGIASAKTFVICLKKGLTWLRNLCSMQMGWCMSGFKKKCENCQSLWFFDHKNVLNHTLYVHFMEKSVCQSSGLWIF